MEYTQAKRKPVTPRIIIHGGAGNITQENLPPKALAAYRSALLGILGRANEKLSEPHASALDVATYAVSLLELDGMFNSGRGAVFTTAGTHELEASVMVSRGYNKRGCGVMCVKKAKSPIMLAKEMLIRGQTADGGGAQGHCQLQGEICDKLNDQWGLESVKPSYFWVRKRWDEHRKGLGLVRDDETYDKAKKAADSEYNRDTASQTHIQDVSMELSSVDQCAVGDIHWNGRDYLPQGTVGAVVLDSRGVLCVATSTGGLTNKLPGRIGDTPTLGAGFWAEEWQTQTTKSVPVAASPMSQLVASAGECFPGISTYLPLPPSDAAFLNVKHSTHFRGVAMSGTGNGDSFLRVAAARTAAAMVRFGSQSTYTSSGNGQQISLQQAVTAVAGPHGELQLSAGDRWHKTGEGEGGIIGIELDQYGEGHVVFAWNCGGMFHAWIDDNGEEQFEVFQPKP
ncbi:related to putative L-asparaginase precursor [Ramularia collo-cygni]|uniref:Related to putative L-asparaginase n=1 Tax=Ramularia collo-cygni TaxID=112498 RepID=A0A2D3UX55_9PEZI|nr:related to putative L-asparaginase precursor [Ramularia collo-cygni]CZT22422.1 related to putative L-asparaginase precursor [Ramularia collo-cygni]